MSRFQEYIESDQGPEDLCKEIEQLNKRLAEAYSIYDKEVKEIENRQNNLVQSLGPDKGFDLTKIKYEPLKKLAEDSL